VAVAEQARVQDFAPIQKESTLDSYRVTTAAPVTPPPQGPFDHLAPATVRGAGPVKKRPFDMDKFHQKLDAVLSSSVPCVSPSKKRRVTFAP
jgi:hypothetical protein